MASPLRLAQRWLITPETALRLARYFNTTAQFWLNLQSSFDLKKLEQEAGEKITAEIRPQAEAAAKTSEASFATVWDNDEDAADDKL